MVRSIKKYKKNRINVHRNLITIIDYSIFNDLANFNHQHLNNAFLKMLLLIETIPYFPNKCNACGTEMKIITCVCSGLVSWILSTECGWLNFVWLVKFCQFLLVLLAAVSKLIIIRLRLKSWGLKTLHIDHQSLKKIVFITKLKGIVS